MTLPEFRPCSGSICISFLSIRDLPFAGPSTCGGKDDDDDRPRLVLAPANATVSPGVGVTLGCAASTAVRACQWSFYPEKDPGGT